MTADTFVPAIAPSVQNSQKSITYRTKTATFGDDYVQEAGDGINTKTVSWPLTWTMINSSDAQDIEDFMDALGGFQSFTYTVPGDIQRRYKCKNLTRTPVADDIESITATFVEFRGT